MAFKPISEDYVTRDSPGVVSTYAQNSSSSGWNTSAHFFGHRNDQVSGASVTPLLAGITVPVLQSCQSHLGASDAFCAAGNFSKLSLINGAINKMNQEHMQRKLAELSLNNSGVKQVLKKRLKNYFKQQRLAHCNKELSESERVKYDYLVIIDFEATCSQTNKDFMHEIIEFPAVLVDAKNQAVCNIFQRFCKPRVNPVLTDFCTALTGISQSQVDRANDFTVVFREFEKWLALHGLGTVYEFAVVTDGPWDMERFLKAQVEMCSIEFPLWAKQWINIRKAYTAFYNCGRVNLRQMLDNLGMKFQGRPHCGLDDSRNIAAIVVQLLQDGCIFRINEYFRQGDFTHSNTATPLERPKIKAPSAKAFFGIM